MATRKNGFVALGEEDTAQIGSGDINKNIARLLLVVLVVSGFGIYQSTRSSSNPEISANNGSPFTNDWDVSPYRFDFLVRSPYGQTSDPYTNLFMPLYTTHPLHIKNTKITSVVISIHGYTRNAEIYFRTAVDAVKSNPNVLVILPYFTQYQLKGSQWGVWHHGYDSASLHWNTSGWMKGSNASPLPYRFTSSFDIMDDILQFISNPELFPSLTRIVIAGYSAGSQYASHYAWATQYNITESNPNIHIRYLLSGSSSFLYVTPHRPAVSCLQQYQLGVKNDCQQFDIPNGEYLNTCAHYDHWKYGLTSFPKDGYLYLQRFIDNPELVNLHTNLYRKKDVRYITGDHDTCNCNTEGYVNEDYCYDIIDGPREINTDDGQTNDDDDDGDDDNNNEEEEDQEEEDEEEEKDILPSSTPTSNPSSNPSSIPSSSLPSSSIPTSDPSFNPSPNPSSVPSAVPTSDPSFAPTTTPSNSNHSTSFSSNPNEIICLPVHSSHSSCCDTYPDTFHNLLSLTCGANFQGYNRLQRAVLYLQYLKIIWKDENYTPSVELIHGMGHDRKIFFESKTFQEEIFMPRN